MAGIILLFSVTDDISSGLFGQEQMIFFVLLLLLSFLLLLIKETYLVSLVKIVWHTAEV